MTEWLHFHFSLSCIGGGNGNPLQCSCLESPRDGEPGGLPSMGSHRVGHDWSHLAAALKWLTSYLSWLRFSPRAFLFCHSLLTLVARNQYFQNTITRPHQKCSLVSVNTSFVSCCSFSSLFLFSSLLLLLQLKGSHLYGKPQQKGSTWSMMFWFLPGGCTPLGSSLMGTPALPAPAEISLNGASLQGQDRLNMFTRCVAISNILQLTLINGESGWGSLALKRAKLHQCLGFKLIPKNHSSQVCFE